MSENKKTLFLLDAYALIFRAYYAFIRAPRINSRGLNTSAIYGFVNALWDIVQRENPTHLAVAIDFAGPTFRNEMYSEYKANRESTPEDIKKAVPYIRQILKALRIPLLEIEGFEADDVIGTLALRAGEEGFDTYMVTPDKDYAQLVNERVKMYKPKARGNDIEILGPDEIRKNFNVPEPINVIDILALWGDSADNVPGCPGVGEKRSKEMVAKYHNIDNIYAHIDDFSGKQKENLINFRQQVELARKLVTIHTQVPLEVKADDFIRSEPDLEALKNIFEELEFRTLWKRISGKDLTQAKAQPMQTSLFGDESPVAQDVDDDSVNFKSIDEVKHQYFLVDNEMAVDSLAMELAMQTEFCFDTETSGLNVREDALLGIAFSWNDHEGYYLTLPPEKDKAVKILDKFRHAFDNPGSLKIGQNIKFDLLMLRQYGINVGGPLFDTMVAHHLLQPGLKHNMDYLSEVYLHYRPVSIESLIGSKGKNQGNMRDVDIQLVKEYACEDADVTYQLKKMLDKELHDASLTDFFEAVEMPLVRVLAQMEEEGARIDTDVLKQTAVELEEKLKGIQEQIFDTAGMSFNVNSPKQVGEILFEHLKIESKASKTKTGQFSTSEENLQKLRDKHPVIGLILEQRGIKKLLSTYVYALPQLVDKHTGRIHTSYNQAVVVTGRLSSTNPNLQNIPIRDDEGKVMRKAFVPRQKDWLFFSADYSQVELRLMAHLSGDTHLVDAFRRGEDIHAATAARIFKVPIGDVTSDMRRKAKTANFGIIYGISAFGLSERLNIPRGEAKSIIDGYFESFPGVKLFMEACIATAREKGYVETLSGRKRYLPDINSRNAVVRGVAERNAINAPIQGTAADIIKKAMVDIQAALAEKQLKSKMILQVHDELNFDVAPGELEILKPIVIEKMQSAYALDVPLLVDTGVGQNWLDAH